MLAMRELRLPSTTRTALQLLMHRGGGDDADQGGPHGKRVLRRHDVESFTLRCSEPLAFQLDGDYLGQRDKVRFTSAPSALRVIC
jgi:diacylglycerol kinase family enzyme